MRTVTITPVTLNEGITVVYPTYCDKKINTIYQHWVQGSNRSVAVFRTHERALKMLAAFKQEVYLEPIARFRITHIKTKP